MQPICSKHLPPPFNFHVPHPTQHLKYQVILKSSWPYRQFSLLQHFREFAIRHKLVDDGLDADEFAHQVALRPADAQQPRQRHEDNPEQILEVQ